MATSSRTIRNRFCGLALLLTAVGCLFTHWTLDDNSPLALGIIVGMIDLVLFYGAVIAVMRAVRYDRLITKGITAAVILSFAGMSVSAQTAAGPVRLQSKIPILYFANFQADPFAEYRVDQVNVFVAEDGRVFYLDGTPADDVIVVQDAHTNVGLVCIVVGGAVLIGGVYVAVKIYKCAKKNLNPAPPPPPTNQPPSKPGEWDMAPARGMKTATTTSAVITGEMPDGAAFSMDDSVAANGWTDWQGNGIAYVFFGQLTNMTINGTAYTYQTSTNLINWKAAPYSVMGWVSTNAATGMDSNQVCILSTVDGIPFATNWSRFPADSSSTNSTIIGTLSGIPVNKAIPAMFFRAATNAVVAQ